ncbi:MBL fold metallo-hydrolase [Pseudooceanicola algae]|uniref:Uncharacterized protein n=1 Tax=Pseudooceanicola algae TaxID=1537215 RepID=A0A418SI86_9RHOB|nr:MBL fold metallo-hydrolase [Pseudooceanicola algae]QPM92114.1 hypothetical protein PSAL_033770 [Pseudooceanicola algae]
MITRRHLIASAAAATAGASLIRPFAAMAQNLTGDIYALDGTDTLSIHPISHASFVMTTPAGVIYVDPVGGGALYEALPAPDAILITHHHGDHFDPDTLAALTQRAGGPVPMITNPTVHEQLDPEVGAAATAMENGQNAELLGLPIEAIPAYNFTEERLQYHPKGRDNGYIIEVGGKRVYIAGDTEDTDEMKALEDIDIAFVPFNMPYTMTEAQAATGVGGFAPGVVYPYHYNDSDLDLFESLLSEQDVPTDVVRGTWYS